jgi:hypothetical protein
LVLPGGQIDTPGPIFDDTYIIAAAAGVRNTVTHSGYTPLVCNFDTVAPQPGSIIVVCLSRFLGGTPSDTYPAGALLCGLRATYQLGAIGQSVYNSA